mmetsp:Transcript_5483/g.9041  ORF Transcript_5483/g.9041 Transcript_5483/m.9041 type:complete len:386 (+) Transcript_5483:86-1243(+)|eukprot:CAMPEP_0119008650 /NCGR_PEP_ID=MMETSP1176-20130426/3845_1 /TAXON_ID=265551 /ORGANISM="Synedropsis recta cf, Strain CCMP1620" /LENGTH=385 /DNA_ID=CAMNT_0006961023 /DNA_START=79 /DNA_END=1236 /DNA_ORIENTATION=-
MKWTSKVLLAGAATSFVVLCSHHSPGGAKQTSQLKRRELSLFDPRSVNEKSPPSSNDGAALEFVHIPRTGGTAVEASAWAQKQIVWGACHGASMPNIGCDRPDWPQKFEWMGPSQKDRKYVGESWLAPPKWLHPNPYATKDTFCIIRNPYDRIVSEYHSIGSYASKDPRDMNEWIQLKLREVMKMTTYPGHFLPQHFYVYDHHRKQAITHVLRYESLAQEFHGLMKHYNLNIEIPQKQSTGQDQAIFAKEFLSPDTIAMINSLYGADFRVFGYPMVERPSQFAQYANAAARVPSKLDMKALMGEELPPGHDIDAHDMAQQQAAMAGVHQGDPAQAAASVVGQPQEVQIQTEPQQQQQNPQQQQQQPQAAAAPVQQQQGEAISVTA